ncbi:MAG: hypothetical protein ACK4F9_02250, partial [Brevinematia bacterium]
MRFFRVIFMIFSVSMLLGCDFYTLYFIKKSLEGDFSYIDKFSSKYSLRGESFSDIPISSEEKILPEFVEDKVQPIESEKDLFPGSKEKASDIVEIFSILNNKITIDLPKGDGVWLVVKYPSKVSYLDSSSDVRNNKYVFVANNYGKDNAIFTLFSSNGNVLTILEYDIKVVEGSGNSGSITSPKKSYSSSKNSKGSSVDSNGDNIASNNSYNSTSGYGKFDITDNERDESLSNVYEPTPPSDVGKLDLKSLVGNETKFFENIDNIAKKYGYYRALKEIEN